MAWSIFTDGGGPGTAVAWAQDLLAKIGAPVTPGNVTMVYDWEKSEGGGGRYNPLNQGPVPGHPELTTTGQQYGGGAADYASWDAGLQGAADYLAMPNYAAVRSDLVANNPAGAAQALWASPWAASHYGYGRAWYSGAAPGTGGATIPTTPAGSSSSPAAQTTGLLQTITDPVGTAKKAGGYLGLVFAGVGMVVLGVWKLANPSKSVRSLVPDARTAAEAAAL